jgi:flagellar motor switch protein FliN/FliY
MASDNLMDQSEIERLLSQSSAAKAQAGQQPAAAPEAAPTAAPSSTTPKSESEAAPQSGARPAAQQQAAGKPSGATVTPEALASLISQNAASTGGKPSQSKSLDDDSNKLLAQEEIEKLLSQAGRTPAVPPPVAQQSKESQVHMAGEGDIPERDVEFLLRQAEQALASIGGASSGDLPQGVSAFRLEELKGAPASTEAATFDLIRDVELDLRIELGRTHMYLEDVLKLRKGSVVPLDKMAGEPVDIYVNGRLIARGEVLVLNDNFCVRVAELVAGTKIEV